MEKFIDVKNKVNVLKNILEIIKENNCKMVLEYEEKYFQNMTKENIMEIEMEKSAVYNYDKEYILKTFEIKDINYYFISTLFAYVSTLSVFENDRMVVLIADNFHKHCFSCSNEFYEKYSSKLNE